MNQNKGKKRKEKEERQELARRKKIRNLMIISISIVVVIAISSMLIAKFSKPQASKNLKSPAASFSYTDYPVQGNAGAPLKIVEFADFKCPSCQRFSQLFEPQIVKDFVATGKAQFYFVNYPFLGADSITAALAAESVYHQNKAEFWKYYHALYDHQGDETKPWATPSYLVSVAKDAQIAVNYDQMLKDIESKKYLNNIVNQRGKGDALKIPGTPTIYINGQHVDLQQFNTYKDLQNYIIKMYKEASTQ